MADRYELKTVRQGSDGKTYWTKIGVAFPMKDKDGFNVSFDALPIPQLNNKGELVVEAKLWPPYEGDAGKK
tara:strand:+ start:1274 stop:1486 length:213 start_codon:yes stop_codon:yes gene_type:complete